VDATRGRDLAGQIAKDEKRRCIARKEGTILLRFRTARAAAPIGFIAAAAVTIAGALIVAVTVPLGT